ncbi:general substrate transporter [Podospora fimiseda]|uniref:General substrate transporter n=1 Tax=Podospora fimiseda TaxID=252190 RepID=A0AAN7BRJ6_9PEZI|nr:general substrate transporter [Podospora fimiseda]
MAPASAALKGTPLMALLTSALSTGFLLFGYDQGVMSGVILSPSFLDIMGSPSPLALGTLVSVYTFGAIFGSILSAFTSDKLGRKRTLIIGTSLVFIFGLGMALSGNRIQFGIARTIVGVGIGYITSITPVYQSEVSRHEQRGWQVCCQLTTMLVGLALAYWVNYGFYFRPGEAQWRVPLALQCLFAGYILVMVPFLPDTPRWLLHRFPLEPEQGREVLARLRGKKEDDEEVRQEVDEILKAVAREVRVEGTWGDLLRGNGVMANKRFALAVGIQFMQQMTGINIVTYYAPTLYKTGLGMSEEQALLLGGYTQLWYVLASFITWYTIDRVGRRVLFISMALGMCAVLVGEGLATASGTHLGALVAVVCLFLFEGCFTWGWMACVWVYPPEILPLGIRAKGSALAAAADFIGNWLVVELTPVGIANMGWKFYLVWAVFNFVNAIVVWLLYPETGGLMLEAVDHVFAERDENEDGIRNGLIDKFQWSRVRVAADAVKQAKSRDREHYRDTESEPLL